MRPGIIDARARYPAVARQLRNTGLWLVYLHLSLFILQEYHFLFMPSFSGTQPVHETRARCILVGICCSQKLS